VTSSLFGIFLLVIPLHIYIFGPDFSFLSSFYLDTSSKLRILSFLVWSQDL